MTLGASLNVADYGAIGDGSADDLAALERARDAAAQQGKVLYFPKATYGISDRFMFADGGDTYFEPGATLKLLKKTTSGGAVSGPYPSQTKPIQVINLTIDCNGFEGQNGIGFGHIVGAKLVNLTVRNCLHNPSDGIYGGKALQFEGAPSLNVQVLGLNIENSTVGIDIGAHSPRKYQTIHVSIYDVSMKNVDIPVHVNDTWHESAEDSYDSLEILIDGLHCRNCGRLTYKGVSAIEGGIFVADRGYKLTARNVQVVNDQGITGGSLDYGEIGAIVRGSWKGLILEDMLFVGSSCSAVFDFTVSQIQAPNTNQFNMYAFSKNIRIYAKVEHIVKGPEGGRIGPCILEGIEVTSADAPIVIHPDLQEYSNAVIEVIDRSAGGQSTGLRTFNRIAAMGSRLSSKGMLGDRAPSISRGAWCPSDGSGENLKFTSASGHWFRIGELVVATGSVTYPANASGVVAKIGGFPFLFENIQSNENSGSLTQTTVADVQRVSPELITSNAILQNDNSVGMTNASCSGGRFGFTVTYLARV